MKRPSLRAPSFRLRKSSKAVLSDSGNRLVQVGARVVVWDTSSRKVISEFKVISNEWHIGISPDDRVVVVKGENGELVFCDMTSGEVISKSKRAALRETGCRPQFTSDSRFLLDGCWDGSFRLWEVESGREIDRSENTGYMVTDIQAARHSNTYFASLNRIGDGGGGARIVRISAGDLDQIEDIPPILASQTELGGWRSIEMIAVDQSATHLIVALNGKYPANPNTVDILYLASHSAASVSLPSRLHTVRGLACSEGGVVAVSVNENLYRCGMSPNEFTTLCASTEHSHIHFYDVESLEFLARWVWHDAWMLSFSSVNCALAIGSRDEPGAYLANYPFKRAVGELLRSSERFRPTIA